jgi:hypothetical protein
VYINTFLFGLTLSFTELFSLEDGFDGLRTAPRVGKTTPGLSEEETPTNIEHDEPTPIENEYENLPQSVHPSAPSLRPIVSLPAQSNPAFTFTFPSSSSSRTRPTGQKGGRCSVCTKALCPRRHECNGSVNRAWCGHGHPPLQANEKVRWTEVEVERRISARRADG